MEIYFEEVEEPVCVFVEVRFGELPVELLGGLLQTIWNGRLETYSLVLVFVCVCGTGGVAASIVQIVAFDTYGAAID